MTTTTASATYQVLIATAGATQVSGNVDLTLAVSDLADIPAISGPSVDLLQGRTTSHPLRLECIVDTVLFPSGSRLTELGRLIEVRRDVGAGMASIATGRISSTTEVDTRGRITLGVSDERWVEQRTTIFETTDTVQLHPPGMAVAWRNLLPAGTIDYTVLEVAGDYLRIRPADEDEQPRVVPRALRNALLTDLKPPEDRSPTTTTGNFVSLKFEFNTVDYAVVSLSVYRGDTIGEFLDSGSGFFATGRLLSAWVYIPSHGLSAGSTITPARFHWPDGVQVSDGVPLHVGGTAGLHPMVLLEDITDGDYGGPSERFDATAMTAAQALSMRSAWLRVTAPAERKKWLEDNLYRATGAAPLVGTDLNLRPKTLGLPQNVDPGTLVELTASNARDLTWEHTSADLMTVLRHTSRLLRAFGETDESTDPPIDGLETYDFTIEDSHDNVATLGEIVHEVDTDLIFDAARAEVLVLARERFDVFGDGPIRGEVTVFDDAGVEVGDYVVLNFDSVKLYNPTDAARTGKRVVLIYAFTEHTPSSTRFLWLDLGPNSSPLSAPTVSIVQNGTDADLVDVTISGLAAGTTATVEVGVGASPTYTLVRANVGNETVSFRVNAGSGTAYARAYATAFQRIRSMYGTDSVALSTRARIDEADLVIVGSNGEVTWKVPSSTLGMRTDYDIHQRNEAPTFGSNVQDYDAGDGGFTVTGLLKRQVLSVRLIPYTGWTGAAVSGTPGDAVDLAEFVPATTGIVWNLPPVRVNDVIAHWLPSGLAAGGLRVRINTEGANYVRYSVSTSAFPTEATVDAQTAVAVNADGFLEDSFAAPYDLGGDIYVSVKAYEFDTFPTPESELVTFKATRPAMTEPRVQADWVRVSSTTAALDLTIDDPTLSVEAVRFNKREGSETGDAFTGFVTTWDRSTGTIGVGATLTRGEDVETEEGQESIIRWEVDFQDENGVTQTIAGAHSSANQDEHSTTLVIPASDMDPIDESTTFARTTSGLLHPNVVGSPQTFHKGIVFPAGVEITNVSALMSRADAGDTAETIFYRNTPSQSTIATLTHSTTGEATVSSGAISETVASDGSYSIRTQLESGTNVNDAYIRWVSVTYVRHHQNEKY